MTDTPPVNEDQVRARRYPHPALGGRPVVRLVADGVAPGTDVAMEYLGFGAPHVYEPSLTAPRRPLGYPGWALVNDPDNASAALAAAKEMRKAADHAAAKPKTSEALYTAIGQRVPVGHLPALFEQAARDFLDADRVFWASTFFGRAREAELVHALDVNTADQRTSYIEFAIAGAVTIKALKAYANDLRQRYEGPEAYDVFLDLTMQRTKAGVPPWTGVVAQFKDLAKAAALNVDTVLNDLARRLLRLPATRRAPAGFWSAMTPVLARLVATDDDVRRRVVELFPEEHDWWWPFLHRFDAASAIHDVPGWLGRAHAHVSRGWRNEPTPVDLVTLVPGLAPRVDKPLKVSAWTEHGGDIVNAELVEAFLAAGIPVEVPDAPVRFDYRGWECGTDLASVVAREEWHPLVRRSVGTHLNGDSAARLLAHDTLRPFVHEVLNSWIAQLDGGGLTDIDETFDRLERALVGAPYDPVLAAAIKDIDVADALARALRAGVLDEYGWPALDEAIDELKRVVGYSVSWPVLTVWDDAKAIALGPQGIVARFHFPPGPNEYGLTVTWSDGQFLVSAGWGTKTAYWSSRPDATFEFESGYYSSESSGLGFTMLDPDGRRLTGEGPLHAGTEQIENDRFRSPHHIGDGTAIWDATGDYDEMHRLEPVTGRRESDPSRPEFFVNADVPAGERLSADDSSLARLPDGVTDSPLGTSDGMIGAWVSGPRRSRMRFHFGNPNSTTIESVDGRRVTVRSRGDQTWWPHAIIDFPHATGPVVLNSDRQQLGLVDPATGARHWRACVGEGDGTKTTRCEAGSGATMVPPAAYWHFMRPRSRSGSQALRTVGDHWAARLIALPAEDVVAAVRDTLPCDDERLLHGVAGLVGFGRQQADRRDLLTARPVTNTPPSVDFKVLALATKNLLDMRGGFHHHPTLAQIQRIGEIFVGLATELDADTGGYHLAYEWVHIFGGVEAIAWRAASPAITAPVREALLTLLELWADTPFADPTTTWRVSTVEHQMYSGTERGEVHVGADLTYVRFWDTVLSRGSAVPKATVDTREYTLGWGTADRLREFVRLARQNGPVAWSPAAVESMMDTTGLSRATASWLLLTIPPYDGWPQDRDFEKLIRETSGLKAKAVKSTVSETLAIRPPDLWAFYTGALPTNPAALWEPDATMAVAEHLAARYAEQHGRRTSIPQSTVETMVSYNPKASIGHILAAMVDHTDHPALMHDVGTRLVPGSGDDTDLYVDRSAGEPLQDYLSGLVHGMYVAYLALPAGDLVRSHVPALFDLILTRLSHPELILACYKHYSEREEIDRFRDLLGDRPYIDPDGRKHKDTVDAGQVIVRFNPRDSYQVFVRPALLDDRPLGDLARQMATGWNDPLPWVGWVQTWGLRDIAARIAADDLPEGAYEANAALSAPDLVAEVAASLDLTPDAAVLYLQLLSLPEPTDRNIRRWNAWTAARHGKAVAALLERDLVIEATRARAGRKVFIPGPWTVEKTPRLPLETAKIELFEGPFDRYLPLCPLPVLYAEAWRRRTEGTPTP